MADDQLRMGEQPEPEQPSTDWFRTDSQLAMLLLDVEHVLRGVLAKISAVRRFLQHDNTPEPDPNLMRLTLEHLADPDHWEDGRLLGPHTAFEMAATALGRL